MDLSVIIVSYNVKYFLEQCICSVKRATQSLEAEVFVVDNNSSDGSIEFLRQGFPFVHFISKEENTGFAKANNTALQKASGRNILFLNPDTILAEDSLIRSIAFLEKIPGAGALGIRMIDGGGSFLKESKRGFPTAWTSFCKMSGLTAAFPSSRIFARYYMGYLAERENHVVEALSGAFMLVKKEVLKKTGGFDERFFMYAEDIDLSYRIQEAGYQNIYFSESTIIHFKGESTYKNARYVKLFYLAMIQYVQKHTKGLTSILFTALLGLVLKARTTIALVTAAIKGGQQNDYEAPTHFAVRGDVDSIKEISSLVLIKEGSDDIIYCTGNQFSNAQMIGEMEEQSGKKNFFVHTYNTQSIIGSSLKDKQGISMSGSSK